MTVLALCLYKLKFGAQCTLLYDNASVVLKITVQIPLKQRLDMFRPCHVDYGPSFKAFPCGWTRCELDFDESPPTWPEFIHEWLCQLRISCMHPLRLISQTDKRVRRRWVIYGGLEMHIIIIIIIIIIISSSSSSSIGRFRCKLRCTEWTSRIEFVFGPFRRSSLDSRALRHSNSCSRQATLGERCGEDVWRCHRSIVCHTYGRALGCHCQVESRSDDLCDPAYRWASMHGCRVSWILISGVGVDSVTTAPALMIWFAIFYLIDYQTLERTVCTLCGAAPRSPNDTFPIPIERQTGEDAILSLSLFPIPAVSVTCRLTVCRCWLPTASMRLDMLLVLAIKPRAAWFCVSTAHECGGQSLVTCLRAASSLKLALYGGK